MKIDVVIRITGVLIGIGILDTHLTVNNGLFLIKQADLITVLLGLAEISRWSLGLLAAILLLFKQQSARWFLLTAFLSGLFGSWVSFIPYGGYFIRFIDTTSMMQYFLALQVPNFLLVIFIFFLFYFRKLINAKIHKMENKLAK
ncbi:hypothetical protein [Kaarinaea lacus]